MRGLLSTIQAAAGLMPTANLGSGTASATTFLRGDQTYAALQINALSAASYTIDVGTSGTDVNVAAATSTITINVPNASATARGVLSTGTQTIAGTKTFGKVGVVGLSDVTELDITPFSTQTVPQQIWRNLAGTSQSWIDFAGRPVFVAGTWSINSSFYVVMWNSCQLGWASSGSVSGTSTLETGFIRDGAAGAIAARVTTQAHSLRVYNTWTNASNYERGVFDWLTAANTLRIGTEKLGTGTARDLAFVTDATVRMTIGATSGNATFTGPVIAPAATTSIPSIRLPHGTAPSSPTNGDIWTTTTGVFAHINGSTIDIIAVSGDMLLATAQTVTGAKTFNDTKLLLRNVANTFNGSFVNTNTADRVYTLKDATGTLAFTSDITGTNSGTNTGDQTIQLTGDVTGTGTGTFATTIAAGSVDIAMLSATGTPSASTFLRGDNAWVAFSGFGDVFKVSTPVADQVGVWTGDGTLEGDSALTFDTTTDTLTSVNFAGNLTGSVTSTAKCTFGATVKTPQSYSPSASGTATLDCALGDVHRITMPAGNITIALSNITNGQSIQIAITQDGTGSRTVTWFTTIRWAGGSAPTLTTTASKRDVIVIMCTGSGTYDGFVAGANI